MAAGLALAMGSVAVAAQRRDPRDDICAGFGPGFVAVAGTATCVRISGRVRVEYSFGQASSFAGPLDSTATETITPPTIYQPQIADPAPPYQRLRPGGMKSVTFKNRRHAKSHLRRRQPLAQ